MRKNNDDRLAVWGKDVKELEQKHSGLEEHVGSIHASVKEGIAILDALRINGEGGNVGRDLEAFIKMHEALLYSLDYDSRNYDFILHKLIDFGSQICTQSFGPGFAMNADGFYYASPDYPHFKKKLTDVISEQILPHIKDVENKIRKHKNFSCISFNYSDIMKRFYRRVDIASKRFFPTSLTEFEDF